jgi:hypothetical protein
MALVRALEHGWQVAPVEPVDPDAPMLAPWRIQREDNLPPASADESPMATPVLQQPQALQQPGMPVSYYVMDSHLQRKVSRPYPLTIATARRRMLFLHRSFPSCIF